MPKKPDKGDLRALVVDELEHLWADLGEAVMSTHTGSWSLRCQNVKERIITLTQAVGPTPWQKVQLHLLESGLYETIHHEMLIPVSVNHIEVQRTRRALGGETLSD